jgi:hypothetical protein
MRSDIEHCWPVIHGAADWDDVMLDPASIEVGSSHRIERLMVEDVHRQFVLEQARRFKVAGWHVIYAVFSSHRAVAINAGLIADAEAAGEKPLVFEPDPLMEDLKLRKQGYDEIPGSEHKYMGTFAVTGARAAAAKVASVVKVLRREDGIDGPLLLLHEWTSISSPSFHHGNEAGGELTTVAIPLPLRTLTPCCGVCGRSLTARIDRIHGLVLCCQRHAPRFNAPATVSLRHGPSHRTPTHDHCRHR